jgi:hypothetical protein
LRDLVAVSLRANPLSQLCAGLPHRFRKIFRTPPRRIAAPPATEHAASI